MDSYGTCPKLGIDGMTIYQNGPLATSTYSPFMDSYYKDPFIGAILEARNLGILYI